MCCHCTEWDIIFKNVSNIDYNKDTIFNVEENQDSPQNPIEPKKMKSSTETLIKTLLNNPNSIKTNSQTKQLHAQIIKTRGSKSVSLNTIILGIYSNLNLLKESLQVFNNFTYVPAKAWKSLVRCYCCNGYFLDCLSCFVEMRGWGKLPSRDVFPSVIRACTHLKEFRVGECVHGCVIRFGMESDVYTGNALMNMYAKLQLSSNDCYVFGGIPQLNNRVSSRRSNVYGVAQDSEVGVDGTSQVPVLYQERRNEFDGIPLSNRLSSHGSSLVVDDSVSKGSVVGVDGMSQVPVLYQERRNAFDGVPPLNRFNNRRSSLVVDDSVYSVSQDSEVGVAGIGQVPVLYQERRNQLIRSEKSHLESLSGRMVKNARRLDSVSKIFQMMPNKDVVSWNTVIGGNVLSGLHEEALERLREMGNANLKPDCFTLSSVLPVFARHVDVSKGKEIHGYAIRHGFDKDEFIGSSLIDMYATCTRVEDSYRVFNLLPQKDDVSWNSIIAGCVQNGTFDDGLRLFRQMLAANVMPVEVSFSAILPACAHLTTLHLGKQLHAYITRMGFDQNMYVASSLVDMYAKCGKIMTARWIFDRMEVHDSVSWTAIIMGYALNGHACEATVLFENMQRDGINPNAVAYLAILTACSHAGLVDEGWSHFTSMIRHGVSPHLEHYAAIADLLGRAGKLSEAYKFITDMPIKPTGSVWATLLSACRVHKNVGLAEKVAKEMTTADPGNMSPYLLLSNMYSVAGRWKDASKLRTNMQKKGMRKPPACSWIEVRNQVHAFVSGDTSHPYYDQIHETLRDLYERLKQEGYVPQTSEALHDVDEEQKADLLYTHSERLAIAFGIISTPAETTIRITKNLRVCVDCHTAIKFISKIMEREIIIRDNSRFHLFKDGNCSCGDYW